MKSLLPCLCLAAAISLFAACSTTPAPTEPAETMEEAANPFVGTWKLNVDKSTFNPPESAFKSDLVVIEPQENGLKFTFDRVDAEGNAIHIEEAPKFDGKAYPVTGDKTADSVTLKSIDTHSFEQVGIKNGEEVNRVTVVISNDGMSSTVTATSKDQNGREVVTTSYYDKQ